MVTTDPEVVPGHTETPDSIELKASAVASGCIGAWSVWPIVKDTVFGPYVGDIRKEKGLEDINYRHGLEVSNLETFDCLHVIDATNPSNGNWIRHINCARSLEEQNIISVQQEDQVYFRAIKNIEPGEELLTWFEPRKNKRGQKKKMEKETKEEKVSATISEPSVAGYDKDNSLGKRKRKPKIFPDSYQEIHLPRQKKLKSVQSSDSSQSETTANMVMKGKQKKVKENSELKESKDDTECETSSRCSSVVSERTDIFSNDSVDSWVYPEPGGEYIFELKKHHVVKVEGKCTYKCDICSAMYRHRNSLKRHYLKNHINYRYLSKMDVSNCRINLAQVLEAEKAAIKRNGSKELSGEKENLSSNDAASDSGISSSVDCKGSEIVQHPGLYTCYLCFERFETVEEIHEHTVNHPRSKNHTPFAYDKCEMRFSYIQNLAQHKRVHQANGNELSNQAKTVLPGKGAKKIRINKSRNKWVDKNTRGKQEETNQEKKKSKLGPKVCLGEVTKYQCSRCSMKFGHQQDLVRHQKDHKDEEQIDDGGSRFKFARNMCKRRFSTYINMCRHQSKAHETPEMVAEFYANVADNIAINLTFYIDGGQNSLDNYIARTRSKDYDELPTEQEQSA